MSCRSTSERGGPEFTSPGKNRTTTSSTVDKRNATTARTFRPTKHGRGSCIRTLIRTKRTSLNSKRWPGKFPCARTTQCKFDSSMTTAPHLTWHRLPACEFASLWENSIRRTSSSINRRNARFPITTTPHPHTHQNEKYVLEQQAMARKVPAHGPLNAMSIPQ